MHLLLIEDSDDLRKLYSLFLRRGGHVVDLASNAEDGLLLTTFNNYDAIISDLNLPGLSGFDFISLFRKLKSHAQIPCLAVTASGDCRREAIGRGFTDFLEKPVFGNQLNERLQKMAVSNGA